MAQKHDSVVAGESFPPAPKVNSLQALTRLRAKRGCEWCTFAFVLNRDMIKPDGSLDELHAIVFPLGSFSDQDKAEEHAKNVISITGHPGVIAAKYAFPVPLTSKFDPKVVTEVALDAKGRLLELESAQYKREREEYERRVKQEKDIMKEAEEETNPDSIEHFKRKCYLAIQNRAKYQFHTREAETAWQNYKKREMEVRDHFSRHPEHEKDWLPYLKEKLEERGEMNLYLSMEAAYHELRDELLGLVDPDDNDHSPTITQAVSSHSSSSETTTITQSVDETVSPSSSALVEIKQEVPLEIKAVEVFATTSSVNKVDTIQCECPGGICLGLSTNNTGECDQGISTVSVKVEDSDEECSEGVCLAPTKVEDSDEECSGGVCLAPTKVEKLEEKSSEDVCKVTETDEIISAESLNGEPEPVIEVKQITNIDDDDIIPADAVVEIVKESVTPVDPGFVEEPPIDNEEDSSPKIKVSKGKKVRKH